MEKFIDLNLTNIDHEHICCAISDKKTAESYQLKKDWLKREFANGYVFRRLDARAKVFIEYGPAENGWVPVNAPNYVLINCFWVSGKYKQNGYGKQLLQHAIDDAKNQNKSGLVTVVGTKKFHFMSDPKWLLKQGFKTVETTSSGFSLLVYPFEENGEKPTFNPSVLSGTIENKNGIVVYFSNRCPFAEFHARQSLIETANKRNISYEIIKLETREQAQNAPSPATIFSLFYNGKFITTDISACIDSRFDKIVK